MKLSLLQNIVIISSIFIVIFTVIILKWFFKKVKNPLKQKNKFLSLDIAIIFSIFTIISLITFDPLIICLSIIPTFIIMKNKLETNSNWLYQLILSMFIGMSIPVVTYWFVINSEKLSIEKISDTETDIDINTFAEKDQTELAPETDSNSFESVSEDGIEEINI